MNNPSIELRKLTSKDVPKIYIMSKEKTLIEFLPDQEYENETEAKDVIDYLSGFYEADDAISRLPYVLGVLKKDTQELIGHVGASLVTEGVEIGYAIEEKEQGKGYAKETINAFMKLLKAQNLIDVIYGVVDAHNIPSIKVLEATGFHFQHEKAQKMYYKAFVKK